MAKKFREEILATVAQLTAQGYSPAEVSATVQDAYSVSRRTAYRYREEHRRRLAEANDIDRSELKGRRRAELEFILARTIRREHWKSAIRAIHELIVLDGLAEPSQVELNHLGLDLRSGELTSAEAIKKRLAELTADEPEDDLPN